ncbi:SYLF and SH3 domain-containing protein KNAG_0C02040 [Huiozyma naganishii CBS 8797]|uniref:SH3 domain-containing protein n=1 Tax=Huiozyma naganishii (strain ATCC MYA-139 / BCRC 22969 / CBS 8797 / KCTC 17520 / NBRC 10181 / NCYC 3082 / Yp74L-3) TaxID=1071383 RepID=J7S5Q5_HUIN7|nr:hypothetical protein KNAG_0C02040 [Kazachstania naganishii CBS 8797]CCK69316.1 hypothetical protein KNAG_0C02040 [Kazachstania naganishii CBS 8797]
MGINNPIPRSLKSETRKAAKILASFVKPNQVFGADQVIPPDVLKKAKGLAVITVLKAGFLFSGRAGSGVIVARLRDGTWSAPSAIGMAGAGAGGMVGVELTDFVFILNSPEAVKSFSEFGTITLGGNISVAAGPLGRNAEAAASASTGGVAAVFAYSKTKGLFAGVSVEGSVILERREANRKFYGDSCTSKMILTGRIRPPPEADPLFRVLESRAFTYRSRDDDYEDDDYYDDIPDSFDSGDVSSRRANTRSTRMRNGSGSRRESSYYDDDDDEYDDYGYPNRRRGASRPSASRGGAGYSRRSAHNDDADDFDNDSNSAGNYYATHRLQLSPRRGRSGSGSGGASASRWEDDVYDRGQGQRSSRYNDGNDVDDLSNRFSKSRISSNGGSAGVNRSTKPSSSPSISGAPKAVALYSFTGEESGDLPFRKGDVITVLKKSDSQNDWWTGRVNGREGIFPANYVELV